MSSCVVTGHLAAVLRERIEFKTEYHSMLLREGQGEIRRCHMQDANTVLEKAMSEAPTLNERRLI